MPDDAPELEPGAALPTPEDLRVAEALQRLRSGVRQRRAEAATVAGGTGEVGHALLAVKSSEYVREPVALSHRPRFGRFIVFARKAFFHLFLKWCLRPLLEQQNAYNAAATRLLQELAEAQERTARELRKLAARLDELEAERERRDG
ncbi:MAG TPA: hypothetical protein VHQ90_20405 [Thermoanaerobaculia bacterium]|nr:hypothetical protein [Thermoanaerobaculia bacterium]